MKIRINVAIASAVLAGGFLLVGEALAPQTAPPLSSLTWSAGAENCKAVTQPPLEVRQLDPQTFVLRENLCATWEAPFMYLLLGSQKALLIDSGDVADATQMPLAKTVLALLPGNGEAKLPLLVVHTHRHLDHRAGDGQFVQTKNVQVVGYDLESVKRFYGFNDWPNGLAHIDLGNRVVDVIPTPGHNETHIAFYDRNTAVLFSGDFLMPGRLLIDDTAADIASAKRIADFAHDRPVSFVLGGHVEEDANGAMFEWESQYHPHEHTLALNKADVLALPAALEKFNGIYTESGGFVMMNTARLLMLFAAAALLVLGALLTAIVMYLRRRKARKKRTAAIAG
jgi:hydroxyacylglutathione hydrolase